MFLSSTVIFYMLKLVVTQYYVLLLFVVLYPILSLHSFIIIELITGGVSTI